MRKLKLFFAAAALVVGAGLVSAQTDVTSTYLSNPGFESCTLTESNAGAVAEASPLDIAGGWTQTSSAAWSSSAVVAYGGKGQVNGVYAPSADNAGNGGQTLGISVGWGGVVTYKTDNVTLPAGTYTLKAYAYNNLTDVTQFQSKLGFVPTAGASYISSKASFTYATWESDEVTFTLFSETEGYFQIGGGAISGGSGANAKVFFDNLTLSYSSEIAYPIDMTGYITNPNFDSGTSGWTTTTGAQNKGTATNQTGAFNVPFWENWNGSAYTGKMYQTIEGLPSGVYTLSLCAFVNSLGEAGTQYVYANNNKTNVTSTDPTAYTVEGINVVDGKLEIGFEQTVATANWCGIDNARLTLTGAIEDLTPYVDAYEAALAAAKAVDQTATMAPSILTALQTAISTYESVDNTSQAALEEATAALNTATSNATTSIASYAIIAAGNIPDNSLDGWTCENANTFHINTWSTEGNSDGSNMKTPFIENWVAKGNYLGAGKVYYRLAGLEPGEVYYAQALVRSYNEANSDAPNGPDFFINDVTTSLSVAGTTFTYNGMSGIYATLGGAATIGSDGTLTLGIEIANDRNYNWVAFKNVSISSMDDAFDAAVAKVTALEGTIPTPAYTVATEVVAQYSGSNYPTTAAGFETAIAAIEAAAATAAECVEPYAKYQALRAGVQALYDVAKYEELTDGAHTTLGEALTTAATDIAAAENAAAIESVNSMLKAAAYTYAKNANPTGDARFDLTFMLTNPDLTGLTTWQAADGWASEETDGNSQVMVNDSKTNGSYSYFYEYWSNPAKASGKFALYNTVTLPAGTYTMSCYAFAEDQYTSSTVDGVYFYANDTQGSCVTATVLTQQTLSFVNSADQDVKIGLKTLTGNTRNWMGIGYVELYKVPAKAYEVDETVAWDNTVEGAGAVKLTRTIKAGLNTVVLPFSMTQAEVEEFFGAGSVVYGLNSFADDNISFTTKDGISANEPCLLKATVATVAGTTYDIAGRTIVAGTPVKSVTGLTFQGTYAASLTVPMGSYIVSGDKLYNVDSNVTLSNTRAYFVESTGARRTLTMSFDGGQTTGIATLENGKLNIETGNIYDLSGRRVVAPTKGIYVINGKKVVK